MMQMLHGHSLEWAAAVGSTTRMAELDSASLRAALQSALVEAMKRRDREAVDVYRTTLAAIDNAEAVPGIGGAGAIEVSPVGVGLSEVPRRVLAEPEIVEIVRQEALDRRTAADSVASERPVVAARLRREAALLLALIDDGAS
jgi:hypothetical protein